MSNAQVEIEGAEALHILLGRCSKLLRLMGRRRRGSGCLGLRRAAPRAFEA